MKIGMVTRQRQPWAGVSVVVNLEGRGKDIEANLPL